MLLYEYPPRLDRKARQLKAAHDIEEHKKFQKNMYRNLVLGIVIILLGLIVPNVFIKAVVLLIGAGNIVTAYLLYKYSAMSRDTQCYTRIYDDRIEHRQVGMIFKRYKTAVIYYDDIVRSEQTPSGRLEIRLKDDCRSSVTLDKATKADRREAEQGTVILEFQDTAAKLFLVEKLYSEIKYPKKQYNVIEDDEDEDDLWDPLHKHGL